MRPAYHRAGTVTGGCLIYKIVCFNWCFKATGPLESSQIAEREVCIMPESNDSDAPGGHAPTESVSNLNSTGALALRSCAAISNLNAWQVNPLGYEVTLLSAVMLSVGQLLGAGMYSVPGSVLSSVGSIGLFLLYWVLGPLIAYCGWLSRRPRTSKTEGIPKAVYTYMWNLHLCFPIDLVQRLSTLSKHTRGPATSSRPSLRSQPFSYRMCTHDLWFIVVFVAEPA